MEISGVRRLMTNAIKNFHIFLKPSLMQRQIGPYLPLTMFTIKRKITLLRVQLS